jgi:hypothetical protein
MTEVGLSIEDRSEWTDDEVLEWHRCSENRNEEVGVLKRAQGEMGPTGWILANIEPATEDDVRKGVAPELGVPSRCTSLIIHFCPFCGIQLVP